MTKSDWEELYKKLKNVYTKFSREYYYMTKGRTKKIQEEGKRNFEDTISLIKSLVSPYDEASELLAAGGSDPLRDTFEMGEFLDEIKRKIDSFEQ